MLCKCGCGEQVAQGKQFKWGHNARVPSKETRNKMSKSGKARKTTKETKLKLAVVAKGQWADKKSRAKKIKGMLKTNALASTKEKRKKATIKKWQDPEQRKLMCQNMKGKTKPGFQGRHSEASKKKMSDALKGRHPWNKNKICPPISWGK